MTIFTVAALAAMIANPACGGVSDPDLAQHLQATVLIESHGDQYAIGINADVRRGLPKDSVTAKTAGEAIAEANALIAQGRDIDLGLSQINIKYLNGLTITTAFDECANLHAGAAHLKDDHDWVLAHRRYNCGRTECGIVYAQRVMAQIPGVTTATETRPSVPPPCAPKWDAWALAACSTVKKEVP